MSERPQPTEGLLDAYLDGLLDDADRKAFQLDLDRRHDLRSAVEHQQAIDAALKRLVSPPSEEQLNLIAHRADEAGRRRISPGRGWRVAARRLAVAAALAGGTFGAWQIWDFVRPGSHSANPYVQQPWRSFETVYRDKIADGFQPAWICKDDKEFADSFWAIHRQRLLLGELPEGTKALGLAYSPDAQCSIYSVDSYFHETHKIYRGSEYTVDFLPKILVEIAVPDDLVSKVVDTVKNAAHTGKIGDGKIFVLPIETAIRIRTGEHGDDAL